MRPRVIVGPAARTTRKLLFLTAAGHDVLPSSCCLLRRAGPAATSADLFDELLKLGEPTVGCQPRAGGRGAGER